MLADGVHKDQGKKKSRALSPCQPKTLVYAEYKTYHKKLTTESVRRITLGNCTKQSSGNVRIKVNTGMRV